ncbi:unnamed protein product [Durusdinium trenchii]|uniref:inositol oxygenase n=1 Tax=Durusdinium trenchii TaxID=1381693 RepID=A0ABP0RJ43_9DINO
MTTRCRALLSDSWYFLEVSGLCQVRFCFASLEWSPPRFCSARRIRPPPRFCSKWLLVGGLIGLKSSQAMHSFPQRYLQAYRSELTEFIELVRAGPESEMHRLEQQAMLRHPNVVRTTITAEMSWKQGKTVNLAELMNFGSDNLQVAAICSPEAELAMKDVVKVALVGLGRAGHFHMESVLQLPGIVRLAWVIDIDTEKAKRIATEKGCRWSSSLDAALAGPDAVDAVIIASATDTHFPYIMQALNADKAVLAEKPISHELNEVVEAVELAKQKNLAFVCGYQRRADRHFRELKRQLDAGAIGNLKLLKTCSRDNPIPPMEYLRTSGGIFHDMLIHDFDMLDFLSGGQIPESVTATGHAYHPEIKAMGDVDTCAVMFKYPSGLIAMVDTSRDASYGYDQRIEAFGEQGMLSAKNNLTSTIELATADGHLMPPAMYSFPQRYHEAYRSELTEFIELVRAGPESKMHRLEQQAMLRHPNVVRTTIAAEMSWKQGMTVQVASIQPHVLPTPEPPQKLLRTQVPEGYPQTSASDEKHAKQTMAFVKGQQERWLKFNKGEKSIMDVLKFLDDEPFQRAECIRASWPGEEYEWFHLVGLLHNLGKIMAAPEVAGQEALDQWAVLGDTFPVGCAPAEDACLLPEAFKTNPDYSHPLYGTKNGIYKAGCGISNLIMSWGKDECFA